MAGRILTDDGGRALDSNGTPISGCKLKAFTAGTSTPVSLYTTAALNVAHASPVVASAAGFFAQMWADETQLLDIKLYAAADVAYATPLRTFLNVTPQGRPGPWVSIMTYGAIGDGVANDTAAFEAAVATGSVVHIPAGTYLLNAMVFSALTTVELQGDGPASILKFNTTGHGIDITAGAVQTKSFTIRDLAFDNITNVPTSFIHIGANATDTLNGLIERCYFRDCAATYCIDNQRGYGTKIRGCIFSDVTGTAIRFQDSASQATSYSFASAVIGCDITRPSVDGIMIQGAQSLEISGATVIEGCAGKGINVKPLTATTQAWNIRLSSVYFEANTGADIDMSDCNGTYWAMMSAEACRFQATPTIALGSRSEIILVNCSNSGGSDCTVSGSSQASAMIIGGTGFVQSGTFRWVELTGQNGGQNTTLPMTFATNWGADSVAPAIGNGTLSMVYARLGNRVDVKLTLTIGGTTTTGTDAWSFTLPFTSNTGYGKQLGVAYMDDTGSASWSGVASVEANTAVLRVNMTSGGTTNNANSRITSAVPFTWASTDVLNVQISYFV